MKTLNNQLRLSKASVESIVMFLINPFFALPVILHNIYNKKNTGIILLLFFIGILSFVYIPHITNDKTQYVYLSILFKTSHFDFSSFVEFIKASNRPDFLLIFLIFISSKIGLPYTFASFFVTTFTVSAFVLPFYKFTRMADIPNRKYLLLFLLIIFNISLPTLLSGTRFYFALAFVVLALYYGLYRRRHVIALLLLFMAAITHFSMVLFFPLYIIFANFWKLNIFISTLFLFSFLFILIPKDLLYSILSAVGLPYSYQRKMDLYLAGEDYLTRKGGNDKSMVALVSNYIISSWIYIALIVSIIFFKTKSQIKSIVLILLSISNLVYSIPTVYGRFSLIPKLFFVYWIIQLHIESKINPIWVYLLFLLMSFGFITDLVILREQLLPSIFTVYSLTLFSLIFKTITPQDFIQ